MARVEIPFVGGAYKGRSPNVDAQECVNLFLEVDQAGGRASCLVGTPGLESWVTLIAAGGEVRGLHVFDGVLYAVCDEKFFSVDTSGTKTEIGSLGTFSGPVSMASNTTQVAIVDGYRGYLYTPESGDFDDITADGFPEAPDGPNRIVFQDGYFLVTEPGTGKFYVSGLNDGSTWDALDFATAEGDPDPAVSILMDHREMWIFGEHTTEVFYNSGDADFPFSRIQGAFIEHGCVAPFSVAKTDNTVFWLSRDRDGHGQVMRAAQYAPEIVSTPSVEYQIAQYSTVADARAYTYTEQGHTFYCLTFPTAEKTWVYDCATGVWHQRSSGEARGRHRVSCHVFFNGWHIVGDYTAGKLYKQQLDTYTDDGDEIIRVRACQAVHQNRTQIRHARLEIEFEAGPGIDGPGQGIDPQAMLEWSDDGGHTWSNEHWTDIGPIGAYKTRAVWRRLGVARNRVYRVTISDPVKVIIVGATIDAEGGRS